MTTCTFAAIVRRTDVLSQLLVGAQTRLCADSARFAPTAMATLATYEARADRHPNACAKQLLEKIVAKQSNLCISVDVTRKEDLLEIVDAVGPFVAVVKVRAPTYPDAH